MLGVVSYSTHWPHLFPQHGPGVKHKREIELEPWQERIVERHPDRLDIAWRQDGPWNVSVARREAVAIMDRHVGPKR
jgi:hypothetical protein